MKSQEDMFGLINGVVVPGDEFKEHQKKKDKEWEDYIQDKPEYYSLSEFESLRKSTIKFMISTGERCRNKLNDLNVGHISIKGIQAKKNFREAKLELQEARRNDQARYCELTIYHMNKARYYLDHDNKSEIPRDRMIKILREIKEVFPNYSITPDNLEAFEILILSRLKKLN